MKTLDRTPGAGRRPAVAAALAVLVGSGLLLGASAPTRHATAPSDPSASRSSEFAQDPVSLVFAPAPDTRVTRSVTQQHDLVSQRLRQRLGKTEAYDMAGRQRLQSVTRVTVDDDYLELGDGRPERLRRRYRNLEVEGEMTALDLPPEAPPAIIRVALDSDLQGTQVVHRWVPEEGRYGRHYDLEEGPEELLEHLGEDADLRALLPGRAVRPGDSWEVPADALGSLLSPGGDLGFDMPDEGGGRRLARTLLAGVGACLHRPFGSPGDGKLVATYTGPVTRDDRSLQRVAFEFDVRWRVDLRRFMNTTFLPREREQGSEFEEGTLILKLRGEGEFLWDTELGLPAACSFDAQQELTMRLVELLEGRTPFEQEMDMQGRLRSEMRTRAR